MTPRPRFADLDAERREAILSTAAHEFADHGYAGASVNRIIEAAGISKGTLYYYFDDKEDLFATALEHAFRRFLEDVEMPDLDRLTAEDYWESFRRATRRSLEHAERNRWYVRLARSFHRFRSEFGESTAVERVQDWSRQSLHAYLQRGRELGVVRGDLPLPLLVEVTRAMDDAGDRWLMAHWDDYDDDERQRMAEARMDLLRDMLDAEHEGWGR